jgi:hypothetical protein
VCWESCNHGCNVSPCVSLSETCEGYGARCSKADSCDITWATKVQGARKNMTTHTNRICSLPHSLTLSCLRFHQSITISNTSLWPIIECKHHELSWKNSTHNKSTKALKAFIRVDYFCFEVYYASEKFNGNGGV